MPPGLSSRPSFQKRQRQAGAVLSACKDNDFICYINIKIEKNGK
jgi:hypothetical protein